MSAGDGGTVTGLEGVELVRVRLRLAQPWVTALGSISERSAVLVRAVVDGAEGWGECVAQPEPTYTSEYEAGAWRVLRDHLIPRVAAQHRAANPAPSEPLRLALAASEAMAAVKGHQMAKAALGAAILDASLRAAGTRLVDHLASVSESSEPVRSRVIAGVAVGVTGDIGRLLDEVGQRVAEGYLRVKLKIHPGWDIGPVTAVRAAFGDGLGLQVDANGSYAPMGPAAAAAALGPLDDTGLLLVEQPLGDEDLLGHARLAAEMATPICLDESITSDAAAATALALRACRVVNIKPGRVGGFYEAVRIHDRCAQAAVPVWCGGMLETGVGRAGNLALAALANFSLPGDISAADRYWAADIVEPRAVLADDGTIGVPPGPGTGISVSLPPSAVTDRAWLPAGP